MICNVKVWLMYIRKDKNWATWKYCNNRNKTKNWIKNKNTLLSSKNTDTNTKNDETSMNTMNENLDKIVTNNKWAKNIYPNYNTYGQVLVWQLNFCNIFRRTSIWFDPVAVCFIWFVVRLQVAMLALFIPMSIIIVCKAHIVCIGYSCKWK